ncbi:MAG: hypothetical protein H7Y88_09860 [Phycisphaerales bacterium]|nr:hypothetical protein [Phycisphaerales bacterium]
MSETLTLRAHAKINLALWVGAADPKSTPPGMHPICSWMVPIELTDTLMLRQLKKGEPSRYVLEWGADAPRPSPIDWPIEKDLTARAHRLLEERAGRALPVELRLAKRTPVGGGLGGGSSDGAACLMGVNRLFELGLNGDELRRLSARLGSDVAFFIEDEAKEGGAGPARGAVVSGFGDVVERLGAGPREAVVLVLPPFGCPTGAVYRAFDARPDAGDRSGRVRELARSAAGVERGDVPGEIPFEGLFNDLAGPACDVEPRLGEVLRRLWAVGVGAHVTGSGSTVFAPVGAPGADEVVKRVRAACPECMVVVTRTV